MERIEKRIAKQKQSARERTRTLGCTMYARNAGWWWQWMAVKDLNLTHLNQLSRCRALLFLSLFVFTAALFLFRGFSRDGNGA